MVFYKCLYFFSFIGGLMWKALKSLQVPEEVPLEELFPRIKEFNKTWEKENTFEYDMEQHVSHFVEIVKYLNK